MADFPPGRIISGEREISRADLMARAARAAGGFDRMGIGESDAVALFMRNDFAFLEVALAAGMVGAYPVPVNWHFKSAEAGFIFADCAAKAIVAHADLLGEIRDVIPSAARLFAAAPPAEVCAAYNIDATAAAVPEAVGVWDAWIDGEAAWDAAPRPAPDSMIYTSGTTGRPKGVRRAQPTADSARGMARTVEEIFGIHAGGGTRTVITGPMYHAAPYRQALGAARLAELVVLQPRFDAEELLALIERHRITNIHLVPTMMVRLLALPDALRRRYDISSLEHVVHAAAPCPPEVKRRMIEWWGPVIHEYYGGTESGAVTFHNSAEALAKPGTVGRVIAAGIVRILDDDGRELPPGRIGEIYMRHRDYPEFTYHGREALRREIERDGLITLGDMGYFDDDGYLFVCDRKNDMVISGGVNIYPAEIEAALIAMPGVRDCAVFGIPDDEFGEALCAHVEPEPGAARNADAVRAHLAVQLADYKIPRTIVFDSVLPREDSGKIYKRRLRDPYWRAAGRRI